MLLTLVLSALPAVGDCTPVQIQQGLQSVVCCAGDACTFSVTASGSDLQYSWSHGFVPIPGANGPTYTVSNIDVDDRGIWCVTVSNGCSSETSCGRISVQRCNQNSCTLTQGAYGNPNGQFNGMNRVQLITSLLAPGPILIGIPGVRSVLIQDAAPSASCIIDRLPAGGTPATLPAFGDQVLSLRQCQTAIPLPTNANGTFKNVLLGQTITLSLNLRLSPNLAGIPLCPQMVTSRGVALIPLSVLSSMYSLGYGHSIDGLLQFANRALAGESTGIASLADINAAVDAINVGFDECATLLGCQ